MAYHEDVSRPKTFNEQNFKRWQRHIIHWLTPLRLFWVITNSPLDPNEENLAGAYYSQFERKKNWMLWKNIWYTLGPTDNAYYTFTLTKDLWAALEKKYRMVDGNRWWSKSRFSKSSQKGSSKLECLEKFQMEMGIAKLPPTWRLWNLLKHKREEILINDLISSLEIEEKARAKDKQKSHPTPRNSNRRLISQRSTRTSLNIQNQNPTHTSQTRRSGKTRLNEHCVWKVTSCQRPLAQERQVQKQKQEHK